jgi:hypothetical protein
MTFSDEAIRLKNATLPMAKPLLIAQESEASHHTSVLILLRQM